jgi:predicted DNA-binding transcriptional regulator AlpA
VSQGSVALVREPSTAGAPAGLEPLLTAEQVAAILGVRPKRVYELGIPCVHLSARSLRFRRCDVVSWIEGRRTGT